MNEHASAREVREWRACLLKHFVAGTIRYEEFPGHSGGELCFEGIRHCTSLDVLGCPEFDAHLMSRLREFERKELLKEVQSGIPDCKP